MSLSHIVAAADREANEDGSLQKRASSDFVIKIKPIAKRERGEVFIDEIRFEKG